MLSVDFIVTNINTYNLLNFVTKVYIWALICHINTNQDSCNQPTEKQFFKLLN